MACHRCSTFLSGYIPTSSKLELVIRKTTMINNSLTSTSFQLDGYRVIRNLGVVRGITVRSRSIFGTFGASLQTIVGGNITLFTELCEKTREEGFELMLSHAGELGANAVICVGSDAT